MYLPPPTLDPSISILSLQFFHNFGDIARAYQSRAPLQVVIGHDVIADIVSEFSAVDGRRLRPGGSLDDVEWKRLGKRVER